MSKEAKKKEIVKKTLLKVATKEAVKEFYDLLMSEDKAKEEEKKILEDEKERKLFWSDLSEESNRVQLLIDFIGQEDKHNKEEFYHLIGPDVYEKLQELCVSIKNDLENILISQDPV